MGPCVVAGPSNAMHRLKWLILALAVAGGLSLPLFDITSHAHRISVLPSLQIDAATYDDIGRRLAATGEMTHIPPRQPPGFVSLLVLLYRVVGHSWVAAKLMLWTAL